MTENTHTLMCVILVRACSGLAQVFVIRDGLAMFGKFGNPTEMACFFPCIHCKDPCEFPTQDPPSCSAAGCPAQDSKWPPAWGKGREGINLEAKGSNYWDILGYIYIYIYVCIYIYTVSIYIYIYM